MSNRDLAIVNSGGAAMIDLRNVNYGLAKSTIDKYISSVGGSGRGKKNFPGDQISFKKGIWYRGFGDKARSLKAGTELVFNIPNVMAGWVKWEENDNGKRYPKYTEMRFPAAGQDPIERSSLGDDAESDWDKNDQGQPQDPWKPVLVFPVRDADDTSIHHVLLETTSKCIAGFNLFRDIMDEMKLHVGELPTVAIGTDKTSRDVTKKDKKGREKKEKQVWDIPTFEATGWVEAIDEDNPAVSGGVQVTAEDEPADLGKVEAKSRISNSKPKGLAKTQPVGLRRAEAAKKAPKSRRTVEAVEATL